MSDDNFNSNIASNEEEKVISITELIADAEAMLDNIESNIPISSKTSAEIENKNEDSDDDISMSSTSFTTLSSVSNDIDINNIAPLISSSTWKDLNVLLKRNSFPELSDPNNQKDMQRVLNVFTEIAEQYEKRGKLIEEMVNRMGRNSPVQNDYIDTNEFDGLRRKNNKLEKDLAAANVCIKTMEKEKADLERSHITEKRQLNQKIGQLKQKITFCKRERREEEERNELLQKQLQKSIDKLEKARSNAKNTFEKMMKRPPKGTSSSDETIVQLIEVFREQELTREQEIINLKAQIRSLSSLIVEHENTMIRHGIVNEDLIDMQSIENKNDTKAKNEDSYNKDAASTNHNSNDDNISNKSNYSINNNKSTNNNNINTSITSTATLKSSHGVKQANNFDKNSKDDEENVTLSSKNLILAEQLKTHRLKRQLVEVRNEFERREHHYVKHLQVAENELTNRQNKLEEYRNKIDMLEADLESRPSVNQWRQCQNELEDLQKKFSHAQNIRDLSKYVDTRELIRRDKELHQLGLRKLEHLPHSVAVELLQDICRELQLDDVGNILSSLHKMSLVIGAVPAMESFIHEISQNVLSISKVIGCPPAMRQPKSIADLLDNIIPTLKSWEGIFLSLSGENAFKRRVVDELKRRIVVDEDIEGRELSIIRHLVDVEARNHHSLETLDTMNRYVKEHPEEVVNEFISQFVKLFDVDKPQSLFPRLNNVYVTFNEMKNGYHTLQTLLDLDTTDVSYIVAAVQELIHNKSSTNNSSKNKEESYDGTSVSTAAKYRDLIKRLKNLLGTDVDSLYDTCNELVLQIRRYNELLPDPVD